MEENNPKKVNVRLWKRIALIAGVFSVLTAFLLIANYVQLNRADPVDTAMLNTLVERLAENPDDNELRQQIRELDLLARKAYFTNQWQIKTGGYLLFIALIVIVISLQIVKSAKKIEPEVPDVKGLDYLSNQILTRKWVSVGGVSLVAVALLFAFLTHNELGSAFSPFAVNDSIPEKENQELVEVQESNPEIVEEETPDTTIVEEQADIKDTSALAEKADTIKEELPEFPTYKEMVKNFPNFRAYGGNGIASHKNVPTSWNGASGQNIKWKVKIPLPGYNSPIVWEDKVFLSGANASKREVYCFDKNTGKILWTLPVSGVPGSPASSPKVTDDTGHAAPTLSTDGRRVYAIFSNGDIIACDMDGKKVWARNLGVPGNHYGHSSSLIAHKNVLVVQFDHKGGGNVMGLDVKTGKTLWKTARKVKISWASPVVVYTGKQTEILLIADPYVASYNPWTGKENWKIDAVYGEVGPSVAYADGIVFAENEYARLVAIKLGEKPEILWEHDEYLSDVPSPIATKDYFLHATSYGVVACHEAKTGKMLWEQEFGNGFYSSPMMIGGRIYLFDKKGVCHIFSMGATYKSVGQASLGEDVVSTPASVDGNLFVRGLTNLYCIGK